MPMHTGRCPECGRKHRKDLNGVEARAELFAQGKKRCNKCGEVKDLTAFSRNLSTKDGVQTYCKPCQVRASNEHKARNPEYAERHREAQRRYRMGETVAQVPTVIYEQAAPPIGHCLAIRRSNLERKYGISLDDYRALFEAQGGVCAICGLENTRKTEYADKAWSLAVDHDHTTGKVRGLLCSRCNWAIGLFSESPDVIENAAAYVRKHR